MRAMLYSLADGVFPGPYLRYDRRTASARHILGPEPDRTPKRAESTKSNQGARLRRLERLARWLDDAVRIPGIGVRVGADAALGLVPVVGDIASMIISAYLVREAYKAGAGIGTLARMVGNIGVDAVVGAVPLIGDLFDVAFRANRRNLKLLRKALKHGQPRNS